MFINFGHITTATNPLTLGRNSNNKAFQHNLESTDRFLSSQHNTVHKVKNHTPVHFGKTDFYLPVSSRIDIQDAKALLAYRLDSDEVRDAITNGDILDAIYEGKIPEELQPGRRVIPNDVPSRSSDRLVVERRPETEDIPDEDRDVNYERDIEVGRRIVTNNSGQRCIYVRVNDERLPIRVSTNVLAFLIARSFDTTGSSFSFISPNDTLMRRSTALTQRIQEAITGYAKAIQMSRPTIIIPPETEQDKFNERADVFRAIIGDYYTYAALLNLPHLFLES